MHTQSYIPRDSYDFLFCFLLDLIFLKFFSIHFEFNINFFLMYGENKQVYINERFKHIINIF